MSFRDNIEKIEECRPGYGDKILVWNRSTGWPIDKDDLEAFIDHMDVWYSISCKAFTRIEYEDACMRLSIVPVADDDIGGYGCEYGDFGMDHYHTNPKNRITGITGTLLQGRWRGIKKENPNIKAEREAAESVRREAKRVEALRKSYPADLCSWITAVGGLDAIYNKMVGIHSNNHTQLREEGRHFEWLIGHASLDIGMFKSREHPDYIAAVGCSVKGVYPLMPNNWWAGWRETDEQHPLNRIAVMLADRKDTVAPYSGKVTYIGYGEDCDDDVRRNAKEWLGIS